MLSPLLVLLLAGTSLADAPELKTFPVAGLKKVIVENENGSTKVVSTAKSQAIVGYEKKNFSSSCKLIIEREGETLNVKVSRQSIKPSDPCEVDFSVRLPEQMNVSVSSGSGNVRAEGPFKDLSFQIGSGDFTGVGPAAHFLGQSGSGTIRMEKLNGGGEIKAGSGEVHLEYGPNVRAGKLALKTGSGDLEVKLPKGTKLKATFAGGSGKLKNAFDESPKPNFEIAAEAGSGNLKIEKE